MCQPDAHTGLAYFMPATGSASQCVLCPAGSYCTQNSATACPDAAHTSSPPGSVTRRACQCVDPARVLSLVAKPAVCVCQQGAFYTNSTTDECVACAYPYKSTASNSRGCDVCVSGFWEVHAINQRAFVAHSSAHVDHPLSAQHRAAMLAYAATYRDVLQQTPRGPLCLVCPPGFLCDQGKLEVSHQHRQDRHYMILPGGATSMLDARPCPSIHAYKPAAARDTHALAMVGACFDSAATWQT